MMKAWDAMACRRMLREPTRADPSVVSMEGARCSSLPPRRVLAGFARRASCRLLRTVLALAAASWLAASSSGAEVSTQAAPSGSAQADPLRVPAGREGARRAQDLFERGRYAEAAEAFLQAARGAPRSEQPRYRYNAAIAYARGGRHREAAAILRDLALAPGGDPLDAMTALGLTLYRAADAIAETNETQRLEEKVRLLQEAGEAWAEAARRHPERQSLRRNLAVVAQALPEARERAKIAGLLARYGSTPPPELADLMLQRQRDIVRRSPAAFTNAAPSQIADLERLAADQEETADLWIPLKAGLLAAIGQSGATNAAQQVAAAEAMIEATRIRMRQAAAAFRDLDSSAHADAVASQDAVYGLWKAVAPYSLLLREDLHVQTNIVASLESPDAPSEPLSDLKDRQQEAASLSRLFRERWAAAVPEEGLPAGPDPRSLSAGGPIHEESPGTNAPLVSAENRQKILDWADEAAVVQSNACRALDRGETTAALASAREAERILREIERLLPRPPPSDAERPPEEQPSREETQNQSEATSEQTPGEGGGRSPPEEQPPPAEMKQEAPSPEHERDTLDERQWRAMMEKVLQRSREYEERQRREYLPPSPIERDW